MALFGMDFIGPISPPAKNGSLYILIGVEYFSRFAFAEPLPKADGEAVAAVWLHSWSKNVGWPATTYSDNGPHFCNEIVKSVLNHHGTRMLFGPVSHPRSTGLSETTVRLMKHQLMRWAVEKTKEELAEWNLHVFKFLNNINARYVDELGISPSQVLLGFQPLVHEHPVIQDEDVADNEEILSIEEVMNDVQPNTTFDFVERRNAWREKICDGRSQRVETEVQEHEFRAEDLVWEKADKGRKSHSKTDPSWLGPKMIISRASDVSYWIRDLNSDAKVRKVHVDHLKRYLPRRPEWE
jgi:hypothetical protein